MMLHSYFYDKYLQSYDFYCNSMKQDFRWPVAGLRTIILMIFFPRHKIGRFKTAAFGHVC